MQPPTAPDSNDESNKEVENVEEEEDVEAECDDNVEEYSSSEHENEEEEVEDKEAQDNPTESRGQRLKRAPIRIPELVKPALNQDFGGEGVTVLFVRGSSRKRAVNEDADTLLLVAQHHAVFTETKDTPIVRIRVKPVPSREAFLLPGIPQLRPLYDDRPLKSLPIHVRHEKPALASSVAFEVLMQQPAAKRYLSFNLDSWTTHPRLLSQACEYVEFQLYGSITAIDLRNTLEPDQKAAFYDALETNPIQYRGRHFGRHWLCFNSRQVARVIGGKEVDEMAKQFLIWSAAKQGWKKDERRLLGRGMLTRSELGKEDEESNQHVTQMEKWLEENVRCTL